MQSPNRHTYTYKHMVMRLAFLDLDIIETSENDCYSLSSLRACTRRRARARAGVCVCVCACVQCVILCVYTHMYIYIYTCIISSCRYVYVLSCCICIKYARASTTLWTSLCPWHRCVHMYPSISLLAHLSIPSTSTSLYGFPFLSTYLPPDLPS